MGGRGRAGLLLSTSVAALLIGGGAPAAFAQCSTSFINTTSPGCTNASSITGIAINHSTITSDINNTGTISPNGISLTNGSTLTGTLSSTGTITGGIALDSQSTISNAGGTAISITGPTFLGGIINGGLISAAADGINVDLVSTFGGNIGNSGTINAGGTGIRVTNVATFQGGISSSGTIAAATAGILVGNVGIFTGAINNSGTIAAGGAGIVVSSVNVFGSPSAGGGIVNSGTIAAGSTGIAVVAVATFLGGITNIGTVFAGPVGIDVCGCVETFLDGITNYGLIAASGVGISVGSVSVFGGGITNIGQIAASKTGIAVFGASSFTGNVSNGGLITVANPGTGIGISVVAVSAFDGSVLNSGTITGERLGIGIFGVATFGGGISNSGLIAAAGSGIQVLAVDHFVGGITNSGTVMAALATTGFGIRVSGVGTFTGGIHNSGLVAGTFVGIKVDSTTSFDGGIINAGLITISQGLSGAGISVDDVSRFTGGIVNSGTIMGAATGIAVGCGCGITAFMGGISNSGLIAAAHNGIVVGSALGATISTFSGGITNSGIIAAGTGGIVIANASFVDGHIVNSGTITALTAIDLTGAANRVIIDQTAGLITGDIVLSQFGDTLNITGGTVNGRVIGPGTSGTVNFSLGSGTFTYAAGFDMGGLGLVNFNSGTVFVDGLIQAGTLAVGNGGTAAGTGVLAGDVTVMSGGTLMPGDPADPLGTINVVGTLTFNAGSAYAVHITPSANATTLVNAATTIAGGTVVVIPQLGHYNATSYTILTANGGLGGAFAPTATFAAPFAFTGTTSVSDSGNDVLLTLGDGYAILAAAGANQNQQNVIAGIDNAILSNQPLPPQFQNLANLSGSGLLNALSQLSGENGAGFLQGAFQGGNGFLNLMVNPFLDGRFGNGGGFGAAMGFAAEEPPALPQAAAAFASAMPVKAAPAAAVFAPHYSIWGAAYGGSGRVNGDPVVGSHDTSASAAAFAAGIDYRAIPNTVFGIALAGGGTNWDLTGGLGGGRSDMFQAGVYGSHHWGAAYLSGALAYNFHDVTTNRTVTIAGTDMLTSRFRANGVGARLEGGYRYATPWLGITPYAAAQAQSIALPNYGETATAGSNQFALNFASQTATTTRTELGAWLDRSTRMDNGALLTLYGRLAWAHDFGNGPHASAIFQALPGSNFVVNGAVPARDGALVTGGAQVSLASGWSFLAKFDGEFSSTTSVYSGTGMVKKSW